MGALFHTILYQPIFNIFVGLYNIIPGHDVGIVILVITVILRLVLYPLTSSSIKGQKAMQDLQPKMEAIKKEFPTDKQKQAQLTMELYKNNKINPLTSCLPMLIQLPILIALYLVLRDGLDGNNIAESLSQNLYSFIYNPQSINTISLGVFNLLKPSIPLAILAGAAQFWQAKMLTTKKPPREAGTGGKDEGMAAMMNKQMLYLMPFMTIVIGMQLYAGLTLYWFFSTLLMAIQQYILFRKHGTTASITSAPSETPKIVEGEIVK